MTTPTGRCSRCRQSISATETEAAFKRGFDAGVVFQREKAPPLKARDLAKRVAALTVERELLLTAVKEIASRIPVTRPHHEWAENNGCECVVCVAHAALKAVTP